MTQFSILFPTNSIPASTFWGVQITPKPYSPECSNRVEDETRWSKWPYCKGKPFARGLLFHRRSKRYFEREGDISSGVKAAHLFEGGDVIYVLGIKEVVGADGDQNRVVQ